MKITKKLLAPVTFALASLLPLSGFSQEKKECFEPKNYFFAGAGIYDGTEQSMKDIYGSIPRFRVGFTKDLSKNFSLDLAAGYLEKEGNPYIFENGVDYINSNAKVKMLQLEGLLKYFFRREGTRFYIGSGLTHIDFKEELTLEAYSGRGYQSGSAKTNKTATGFIFLLGAEVPVSETAFIYGEISGRSANINTDFGTEVDVGGSVVEGGLKVSY